MKAKVILEKPNNWDSLTRLEKIDYYCWYTDVPACSHCNHKTGKECHTLSMPPEVTCRQDAPCAQKDGHCYCNRGTQMFPVVRGGYYRNWRLYNENPRQFEEMIAAKLTLKPLPYFRYNDAGEIPSSDYIDMMVRLAKRFPHIKFLAYTKKYELINEWLDRNHSFPDNLTIRFSYWDKCWKVPNPYNLPGAWVQFKDQDKNPVFPKTFLCRCDGVTCSACGVCWNKKVHDVMFKEH